MQLSFKYAALGRPACRRPKAGLALLALGALAPLTLAAQERPYFVTYDHQMEQPGNLELSFLPLVGFPRSANTFAASTLEIGYGATGWWTSELYLDGQSTWSDSTVFTGFRWENRFRLLLREHRINPVLYVEFVDINGTDKSLKEVVGFDSERDFRMANRDLRAERKREMETKLILSSQFKGWNISENFIAEKNLGGGPWEFGYAVGVSRLLALAASPSPCWLCRENFRAGLEVYGGLGNAHAFGLSGTSAYVAPLVSWELPKGTTLRFSPAFGVNSSSHRLLLRFGLDYEIAGFGRRLRSLFQ